MAKGSTNRIDELLASVTTDLMGDGQGALQDNSIRVERLLLEMVRPDPVQPRRVLPETIHFEFHNNRMTPTQALRQLVHLLDELGRKRGMDGIAYAVSPFEVSDMMRRYDVATIHESR